MKRSSLVIGLVFMLLVFGAGWLFRTPPKAVPEPQTVQPVEKTGAPSIPSPVSSTGNAATSSAPNAAPVAPAKVSPTPGAESTLNIPLRTEPLSAPEPMEEVRTEIENLQVSFRDFRTVLGENPVGTNAEITQALAGNNPKQLRLAIPPGSRVNGEGEMCDRWGTPYFFHQLSAKQMEIHSAGPDRKMGTGDDLVVK